ncbi:hypothetical protein Calkr_2586 [Caldicellulosiruptor acetigenus I77R1B]|uniref:DNA 3'-5' helicase n=2 Tax=Caldicellulosiruptor acetigenus TaxID=301953 RepID=E4S905_CALA7|nr:hypothetical protein Calkr_2586 [Caldicellulosiruptor acetigenus I77R1B]
MLKELKKENNKEKIKKIFQFADEIEKSELETLRNSLYIRPIKSSRNKIYKYRISSGERVLFMFTSDIEGIRPEYSNKIVLLAYCKHDNQIRDAKNMNSINIVPFEDEEEIDMKIEEEVSKKMHWFDYDFNIIVSENLIKSLVEENSEDYLYYLSEQQFRCLESENTTIIKGSAGSGKTSILLHKLGSMQGENVRIVYFTYTDYLRDRAKTIFKNYWGRRNVNVEFYSVLDFFIENTSIGIDRVVLFKKFYDWYTSGFYQKRFNFDPVDVWTEIKGIIKGCMGINWIRNRDVIFRNIDKNVIKALEEKEVVKKSNNGFVFNIKNSVIEYEKKLYKEGYKGSDEIKALQYLKEYFYIHHNLIDTTCSALDREYYLELPLDYSIFSRQERENIYYLYTKYEEWLKNKGFFDENDLARIVIDNIKNGKLKAKYDFLLIDEIQDLSEIQLYAIINLVEDKRNIMVAGDVHQIVNPTFFNFGRFKNYFVCINKDFNEFSLSKNYRSQEKIVSLANTLSEMRKKFIGGTSEDIIEKSIRDGGHPLLIPETEENLSKIFEFVNKTIGAAVIVENDEDKNYIANRYPISGRIFTVREAKGLEFNCVFCYNLLSNHEKEWNEIVDGAAKRLSKYRYYFNLFYVAITRAKDLLVVIEKNPDMKVLKMLKEHFLCENVFEIDIEKIRISSPEEKYQYARRLEKRGYIEHALWEYIQLELEKDVERCRIKLEVNKIGSEKVGDKLMEMGEYEDAKEFYQKALCYPKMLKAMLLSNSLKDDFDDFEHEFRKHGVEWGSFISLLNENEFLKFYEEYILRKKDDIILNLLEIEELFEKINGQQNRNELGRSLNGYKQSVS